MCACLYVYLCFIFISFFYDPQSVITSLGTTVLHLHDTKKIKKQEGGENRRSEIEEANLLKDWDFAKFFPSKFSEEGANKNSKNDQNLILNNKRQSRSDLEEIKNKFKLNANQSPASKAAGKSDVKSDKLSVFNIHRRQESDSRINNPFFRGFRRENSDLFPLSSTRHSAIYIPKNEGVSVQANPLRSSGIFNNNRRPVKGEPILTEFVKMNEGLKMSRQGEVKKAQKKDKNTVNKESSPENALSKIGNLDNSATEQVKGDLAMASISNSIVYSDEMNASAPSDREKEGLRTPSEFIAEYLRRPRREKTESDIVYRNSMLATREHLLQVTNRQGNLIKSL